LLSATLGKKDVCRVYLYLHSANPVFFFDIYQVPRSNLGKKNFISPRASPAAPPPPAAPSLPPVAALPPPARRRPSRLPRRLPVAARRGSPPPARRRRPSRLPHGSPAAYHPSPPPQPPAARRRLPRGSPAARRRSTSSNRSPALFLIPSPPDLGAAPPLY
jgi:hypothetical protein